MPDGVYLNALELGPAKLAKEINNIINSRASYYDMFKWHTYYSYYDPLAFPETNGVCELCAFLNSDQRRDERKMYKNIVKWFNDRKDWNYGQENEYLAKALIYDDMKMTSSPTTENDDEENIKTSLSTIKNVIIPHIDDRENQKKVHILINHDIAATASDNYKTYNENSKVLKFDDDEDQSFVANNENDFSEEIIYHARSQQKKNHKHKTKSQKRFNKVKAEDTSIRCPDLETCISTIISNVKSQVNSWF